MQVSTSPSPESYVRLMYVAFPLMEISIVEINKEHGISSEPENITSPTYTVTNMKHNNWIHAFRHVRSVDVNHHQIGEPFHTNSLKPCTIGRLFFIRYPLSGSKALGAEGATAFHVMSVPLQPAGSGPVLYHHSPRNVRQCEGENPLGWLGAVVGLLLACSRFQGYANKPIAGVLCCWVSVLVLHSVWCKSFRPRSQS